MTEESIEKCCSDVKVAKLFELVAELQRDTMQLAKNLNSVGGALQQVAADCRTEFEKISQVLSGRATNASNGQGKEDTEEHA